jgi:hypothetical protein
MEDKKALSTKPTVDLVKELAVLDHEIELKIMKYNLYSMEFHKRFSDSIIGDVYEPKVLVKKKEGEQYGK